MALVYVGGVSGGSTNATYTVSLNGTLTGGIASSPSENDIVVVVTGFTGVTDGAPGVVTSGYAELHDLYANDTRDANLSVSWKLMGATPDTQVEVYGSGDTAYGSGTVVHVWRGVNTSTPFDVTSVSASAINSAVADAPSITPVTHKAIVLACGLGTGNTSQAAYTVPTGMTNLVAYKGDGTTGDVTLAVASASWNLASGAYNPAAFGGATSTTSDSWAAVTLALRPLDSTGGVAAVEPDRDTAAITAFGPLAGVAPIQEASDEMYMLALTARSLFDSGIYDSGIFDVNKAFGTGSVVATEAHDVVAIPGRVKISGTAVAQHPFIDQFSASALAHIRATLSTTETYSADGIVSSGVVRIIGAVSATEEPIKDTIFLAAKVRVAGGADAHEDAGPDIADITGLAPQPNFGAFDAVEAEDHFHASGGELFGSIDAVDGADALAFEGAVYIQGIYTQYEEFEDIAVASAAALVSADASLLEDSGDTAAAEGTVTAPAKYLYYVIYAAALAEPSEQQIKDGLDVNGDPAVASGRELAPAESGTFTFTELAQGLTPETEYRISFVCAEPGKFSNVATSAPFTTTAYQNRLYAFEAADLSAIAGRVPIYGSTVLAEVGPDTSHISTTAVLNGQFNVSEAAVADSITASGRVPVRAGHTPIVEPAVDGIVVSAKALIGGVAAGISEPVPDHFVGSMLAYIEGTAHLAEIFVEDSAVIRARVPIRATVDLDEPALDRFVAGRPSPGAAFVLVVYPTLWQIEVAPDVYDIDVSADYVLQQTMLVNATSRILEVR